MKKAAIDIGTNSVRLLVCDVVKGQMTFKEKHLNMTRIGKDVDRDKRLHPDRMKATVEALIDFKQIIEGHGIDTCPVFATSAVRDAANRADFIAMAKVKTDFDIEVLSGQEEAELGFLGVVKGIHTTNDHVLVIDIGGGSTELILGTLDGRILFAKSLDIGAVRLTDRLNLTHSMSQEDLKPVRETVKDHLRPYLKDLSSVNTATCVGIGGTATTLGAIDQALVVYDQGKIQNYALTASDIEDLATRLVCASKEEKLAMPGLMAKRADIIACGAVILDELLKALNQSHLVLSDYDNLEGAIFKEMLTRL